MTLRARLLSLLIAISLLLSAIPPGVAHAAVYAPATPGLCRTRSDMEMDWVGSIPTNYNSRTLLPGYSHVSGGITPATIRLYGGIKGNLQLTDAWLDYVGRINGNNSAVIKYLFHQNSGWQNSAEYGRVEELVFEGQLVNVLFVSGDRAYIQTFTVTDVPPTSNSPNDARVQKFVNVTRWNTLENTPKGVAYILLIARKGEQLWIYTKYLDCPSRLPATVTVTTSAGYGLNFRATPGGQWLGSYSSGSKITILQTQDVAGALWGRTDKGWVSLQFTSWGR